MLLLYLLPLLLSVSTSVSTAVTSAKLKTVYEWKYFDYEWPPGLKEHHIANNLYNHTSIFPVDVDRAIDGRIFVTTVGFHVPASLSTVSPNVGPGGPLLRPYPHWNYHIPHDCRTIQTVYRVSIDKCNRMWVLDSGTINIKPVCPVKLWVFDLRTDHLVEVITIPDKYAKNSVHGRNLIITPAVEYDTDDETCSKPRVYMADTVGHGMVVYDGKSGKVSRIEDPAFGPDVDEADFEIDGRKFHLEDGIFGIAVSPSIGPDNKKYLVFRPLASKELFITNPEYALAAGPDKPFEYISYKYGFPSQVTVLAFSQNGTLFYALTHETAIGCWDARKPMTPGNIDIAIKDSGRLQFTGGLKVVKDHSGTEKLYIMTSSLQRVWTGALKFDEINFRVTTADVKAVLENTKCSS